MTFKYSICHPENENIEYKNQPILANKVLEIATSYPWIEKLKLTNSIKPEDVHYSPSIEFTCIENRKSFTLTADYDKDENLEFSLWYSRPKQLKILFGVFGKIEKMMVDDVWSISLDKSIKYLEHFVNGSYTQIEALYKK